jgi:predicted amidohydrolase YtcJ
VLDDAQLPTYDELRTTVAAAHQACCPVAIHCVTRVQTVLAVTVLAEVGAMPGDRMEHGALIPADVIPELSRLGVVVITNPGFIEGRGDAYLQEVDPLDVPDLYRCASLQAGGVTVAAGSDQPFGPSDPWQSVRAAVSRRTRQGLSLGESERVLPSTALDMFSGWASSPGTLRTLSPGQPADLCILKVPLHEALRSPSAENVAVCLVSGEVIADNR